MKHILMPSRSSAPLWLKKRVWNHKQRNVRTNPAGTPEDMVRFLAERLEASACLLDLGCGPGHLLAALRTAQWPGHYIGIDISERAIHTARLLNDGDAEFFVGSIENFPFPPRKVDAVTFVESLYYVREDLVSSVLARCRQALIPGGKIHSRMWNLTEHCAYVNQLIKFNGGCCQCFYGTIWSI